MNEKGFGIKEFIIIIAVIFISLIIITVLFKNTFQNSKSRPNNQEDKITYQDLEKELKNAAERYQNDTYSGNTEKTENWIITYPFLKEKKYLKKLSDPKDKKECTGYVEFIQNKAKVSYKPYLKCSNYQTKGYK